MKRVWAPWRIDYILGKKPKKCFLCVPRTKGYKARHYILSESAHSIVLLNKYPYSAGHLMVIPERHTADLEGLSTEELTDLFSLVRFASRVLKKAVNCDGLNIGANIGSAAGAGAKEHFHVHIVPRWNGDHNFMPVLSDTMVISEYLQKTYDRLLPWFHNERQSST